MFTSKDKGRHLSGRWHFIGLRSYAFVSKLKVKKKWNRKLIKKKREKGKREKKMFATFVNKAIMNKTGSTNCLKFVKGNSRPHFPTFFLLKQSHSRARDSSYLLDSHWFISHFHFYNFEENEKILFLLSYISPTIKC